VRHQSLETQTDLTVVHCRDALVSARVQLINAVRGLVKSMGGRLPASTTAAFAGKVASLIPPPLKSALVPVLKSIQHLSEQSQRCDRQVEELARKKYPQIHLLQQVKGVGPLISLAYVLYAGQSGTLSEEPDGGQLSGPATEAKPIRRQFSATKHHQVGQRVLARHAGTSGTYTLGPLAPDSRLRRWGLGLSQRGGKTIVSTR
jgi:transposase